MSITRTNKNIPFIHDEIIEEWDIRSANTSLMRYYGLIDTKIIEKFESLKKSEREPKVGLYLRKYPEVGRALEEGFTKIIKEFIIVNDLDETQEIVSIKKDSVFVRNKTVRQNEFGKNSEVKFLKKNSYTGCIIIPNYEFYYSRDKVDVKGISDSSLSLHNDGTLAFISVLMQESKNWIGLNEYMRDYAYAYKNRELPFNAYREFNSNSKFRVNLFGHEVMMDDIDEELLDDINISFNYSKVYLPIMKIIAK